MINHNSIRWTALLGVILLLIIGCQPDETASGDNILFCGAEKVSGESFQHGGNSFSGVPFQSNEAAFTGEFSVKVPNQGFAMECGIQTANGRNLTFNVWRKLTADKDFFVPRSPLTGIQIELLPSNRRTVFGEIVDEKDGWELISGRFMIPPNVDSTIVRLVNNSGSHVFFDDLSITQSDNSSYASADSTNALHLYIGHDQWMKLKRQQSEAITNGLLELNDEDFARGRMVVDGMDARIDLRLKGDHPEHFSGDQLSFRIKVKGNNSFRGMRTFSMHRPGTKGHLDEWLVHRMLDEQDVLTTRYGFIPIYINGEPAGVYAYEEHFEKQLVESRKRREAPILRFEEDAVFQLHSRKYNANNDVAQEAVFRAAAITPYRTGKTLKSPVLSEQFRQAARLLQQHKMNSHPLSDIYRLERIGIYLAMCDLSGAQNALRFYHQRFYFDPVIGQLEPIAFNCFPPRYTMPGSSALLTENFSGYDAYSSEFTEAYFKDPKVFAAYREALLSFSDPIYLDAFYERNKDEITAYAEMLTADIPGYAFEWEAFKQRILDQRPLAEALPTSIENRCCEGVAEVQIDTCKRYEPIPALALKAYMNDTAKGKISFHNYHCEPIEIVGFGDLISMQHMIKPVAVDPLSSRSLTEVKAKLLDHYYYRVVGRNALHKAEYFNWEEPSGMSLRQTLFNTTVAPSQFLVKGDSLILSGSHSFNKDVLIPAGKIVVLDAGTEIKLNRVAFISLSPVFSNGTKDAPVKIHGNDPRGFTVIEAPIRSRMDYTEFNGMNTLLIPGWILTGAVTFYESDVDLVHCSFSNNICEDALNIIRSDFNLLSSQISHTYSDGFDADYCTGVVRDCRFHHTGNDGIDFSTSEISIESSEIHFAGDKGISGGEHSYLTIKDVKVHDSRIGVASKDKSELTIDGIEIASCNYGYTIYQKKPEFGPAKIFSDNSVTHKVDTLKMIELNSLLRLNGESFPGKDSVDLDLLYGL